MSDQALLVMDYQPVILGSVGGEDSPALAAAQTAVDAARNAGVPVIFVRVAFRAGYPEINPDNKGFAPLANYGDVFVESEPTAQVHPSLNPAPNEAIVTKRRMSAFAGSDLSAVLGGFGVTHLVLAGLTTSGVVLSTLRHASDADFELTVLADACADTDQDVHNILVEKVFPAHADVVSAKSWAASL
ncbi:cysteine hydrolase family protein [Williamsia muralis]|uniref:Isochorismatase n=1 Tax=Williamsia marianensis TaxID=85044 RepID=A0A2G3PK38_WILMA|nr:isochorismatase family cysteine hydrolase [Williamsia marianensis]PHV66187.1 isochorismatase [Williamsia marianensis]